MHFPSADEVRGDPLFLFRQAELLLAERDTLHQKRHVARERAHRLPALSVLLRLARCAAVDAVPVLAGRDRHAGDGEILVELIERRRAAAAARADDARADLHRLVERCAVKQAIEAGDERRVRGRVIDGARHDEAVRLLKLRLELVDHVVKNTLAELAAGYNEMAKAVGDRMKEIQKTSEDRKLLLSSLSHEMRTPVTAIAAYAHSLSHVRMTDEQKREAIAFISDESLRLERLSSKLMQLISLNNRDALEFTSISSNRLIQSLTPVLAPAAEKNNIEIIYDAQTEVQYHIETDLMLCLITNLFDNAVKAGAGRIVIGLNENEIFVSDDGCGIPEDKLAEITEPFYKLDQSRNTEGFGLGLALVKRIAEAHGAALVINSEVAKGTKISVKF